MAAVGGKCACWSGICRAGYGGQLGASEVSEADLPGTFHRIVMGCTGLKHRTNVVKVTR